MDDRIKKDEMGMTRSTPLMKIEMHKSFEEKLKEKTTWKS
jgi:hypothetical protein